ncbi:hypothetical protein [Micromonospora aurantiaca (nom. illeg.)]|uniref:hypothetical protein n=1 Tax=Micromonospora aurantiaca (nom. illeg.) TaxID=47850 RepID=UPI003EB773D6
MTDTGSDMTGAERVEETHAETHTALPDENSRGKSRIDTSAEFAQVRNSRAASQKLTRPLPRKLTFSGLSIGRPEREPERGEINKTPSAPATTEPEPVGPLAAKYLDHLAARTDDEDLAARRRDILDRLRHQKPAHRRSQP